MDAININILECAIPLLKSKAKYKLVTGDRCTGKTWNSILALAVQCLSNKVTVQCYGPFNGMDLIRNVFDVLYSSGLMCEFIKKPFSIETKTGSKFISYSPNRINLDKDIILIDDADVLNKKDITEILSTMRGVESECWFVVSSKKSFVYKYLKKFNVLVVEFKNNPFKKE